LTSAIPTRPSSRRAAVAAAPTRRLGLPSGHSAQLASQLWITGSELGDAQWTFGALAAACASAALPRVCMRCVYGSSWSLLGDSVTDSAFSTCIIAGSSACARCMLQVAPHAICMS
jgi:hypothetical protein